MFTFNTYPLNMYIHDRYKKKLTSLIRFYSQKANNYWISNKKRNVLISVRQFLHY